jgi:hypothetical protein
MRKWELKECGSGNAECGSDWNAEVGMRNAELEFGSGN